MKKSIFIFAILTLSITNLYSQYQTDHPFDSAWVDNFNGTVFNILDYGAIPNDGLNDSEAFRNAAAAIEANGGGKLIIPDGVFIVGEQIINTAPDVNYYTEQDVFHVSNVNQLIIEGGDNTIIKAADNLAYGSFDPVTGLAYDDDSGEIFVDHLYEANAYTMFLIEDSENVSISNLELDGNLSNLNLGGYWGDLVSRQNGAIGIFLRRSNNVLVKDVYTHHHGLDGIEIGYWYLTEADNPTVCVLENVQSEYNARQGLSWIGGIGLTAYNCKFNHTGKGAFPGNPAAGVDIEAENSVCREGKFINCEFINNDGVGMVADSGDGGYTTFENCTFWGTTSWATWNTKPGMVFNSCNFYGSIVHAFGSTSHPELATKYNHCHFEDKEHPDYGVYRYSYLITHDMSDGSNVTFDDCDIVANETSSLWLTSDYEDGGNIILKNSRITHRAIIEADDFIINFLRVKISNTHFMEDYPSDLNSVYYVNTWNGIEVGDCVFIDGPVVRWHLWLETFNPFGWILPGVRPISVGEIDVTSPDGNEIWNKGSDYEITWDFEDYLSSDTIGIDLYKGCEYVDTISSGTTNDGSFIWNIPNTLDTGNDYYIKVVDLNELESFALSDTAFTIDNALSVEEHLNYGVKVFPNPVQENLVITTDDIDNTTLLYVLDVMGKKVLNLNEEQFNNRVKSIDVEKLAKGVYFLSFQKENKTHNLKFIKM